MHEVLVNSLGGLSLPRKSVVRLTDRPDMTLDVYRERKTTMQHIQFEILLVFLASVEKTHPAFLFCKQDYSLVCAISQFDFLKLSMVQECLEHPRGHLSVLQSKIFNITRLK